MSRVKCLTLGPVGDIQKTLRKLNLNEAYSVRKACKVVSKKERSRLESFKFLFKLAFFFNSSSSCCCWRLLRSKNEFPKRKFEKQIFGSLHRPTDWDEAVKESSVKSGFRENEKEEERTSARRQKLRQRRRHRRRQPGLCTPLSELTYCQLSSRAAQQQQLLLCHIGIRGEERKSSMPFIFLENALEISLSVSHSRHTCSNCVCCCLSLKLRDSLRYSLTKGKDRQKTLTRERGRESEGPTTTWTTYFYYVQCFPKSNWSAVAVVFFLSTAWQHQRTMQEHKRERQFYLLNSACLLGWVDGCVCVCVMYDFAAVSGISRS